MHSPEVAVNEARRAINSLNFVGIILNDFQQYTDVTSGRPKMLFYDQPEYDLFWKVVSEELKVPVYIHPRLALPEHQVDFLAGRKWLGASAYYFAHGVSLHVLGLAVNGVFDRFPRLKVIIGHMGEHVVGHRWRADHRLKEVQSSKGLPMQETVEEYFKRGNIYITTSGNFSTKALAHAIEEIGSERVMFSIVKPQPHPGAAETIVMGLMYRTILMRVKRRQHTLVNGGKLFTTEKNTNPVRENCLPSLKNNGGR
jgi:2,3-dihydroxybenzoate decarboxylase